MSDRTITDLEEMIRMVQGQELLLPDFQRGFVWDLEMQRKLVASVLAKMPLGSILLLEADSDEYGCRLLGRKELLELPKTKENILVLLDGQQRLTVLANVFSNLIFYDYRQPNGLIGEYGSVSSVDLLNRFFLLIPSLGNGNEEDKIFGLYDLEFPLKDVEKEIPGFLTEDIKRYIQVESFDEKTEEPYVPGTGDVLEMRRCYETDGYYRIPLYLMVEDDGNGTINQSILHKILTRMVDDVVTYRLEREYRGLTPQEKEKYIKKYMDKVHQFEIFQEDGVNEQKLEECWRLQGEQNWANRMLLYLQTCIRKLELHQIVIPKANRDRAIDIYENLNMGGVTLSTFELVLAKAAKCRFEGNRNLHDKIVDYIQEPKNYEQVLIPEIMEPYYRDFRKEREENEEGYSASEDMGAYCQAKNELSKKYTDAFLNILSLLCHVSDYREEQVELILIKREKILALKADQICGNYRKACEGLDRACFFLKLRCGVRKIGELHYNLILVLLGYLLANTSYCRDKELIRKLEAWYWISIFSGRYDKDQNKNMILDLKAFLRCLEGRGDYGWLQEWKKNMFGMQGFSDEATLLMETSMIPKSVMKNTICQYHLSKTYRDLSGDEMLHTLSEYAPTFEEHHIVPLGTLEQDWKSCVKERRNNKKSIFQSPVNFAYITRESNRRIWNQSVEYYIKLCDKGSVFELNLETTCKAVGEEQVRDMLRLRLEKIKEDVCRKVEHLLQ